MLFALVTGTASRVQKMPRPRALLWGAGLGRIAYRVAGRQRRFADRNLRLAFGGALTQRERKNLTRRVFEEFGKTLVDVLRAPRPDREGANALITRCEGWEHAQIALERGDGLICLGAHIGNWELLGGWIATQGVPLTVVAREPKDPDLGEYLRGLRQGSGLSVAGKGGSVRALLAVLKRGEALGVLPDQNSGDLFVPFFGIPAGTVAGPALLALKTGAPIVPSYCLREPNDSYRLLFLPPLEVKNTGDRNADTERIMGRANDVLETVVRAYPDQWLWLHNRWKSAFEEKNRTRWPQGYNFEAARAHWAGK